MNLFFKKNKYQKMIFTRLSFLLIIILALGFTACAKETILKSKDIENFSEKEEINDLDSNKTNLKDVLVNYGQEYNSVYEVASYLHEFKELPANYITKKEAEDLGWIAAKGNLDKVAPRMSIGGDKFANREGLLPSKKDRQYYECDIDYEGGWRNAKRIVYSNDGLIFYSDDHYANFERIY